MSARDPAELEFALKSTFYYELWMLGETLERLGLPQTDQVIVNALIESFCIHARGLLEFFGRWGKSEAVKAKEYFNGTYKGQHMQSIADDLLKKLHEQIAHMGGSRHQVVKINPADRVTLYNALYDEALHFQSLFPPGKRPELPPRKSFAR
jgi:hypothetical protein